MNDRQRLVELPVPALLAVENYRIGLQQNHVLGIAIHQPNIEDSIRITPQQRLLYDQRRLRSCRVWSDHARRRRHHDCRLGRSLSNLSHPHVALLIF